MKNFGGNAVTEVDFSAVTTHTFSRSPYFYAYQKINEGQEYKVSHLKSYTVYVFELNDGGSVQALELDATLRAGDALQVEGQSVTLMVTGGSAALLIAGVEASFAGRASSVTQAAQLKKVTKPWGHELWINGEHPGYALKQIFIRAPHKTSLQYHNFKQETNVLVNGCAALHYNANPAVPSAKVTAADVKTVTLQAVSVVDVSPPTIHRLEALTDLLLYEVSTPHLNDVIRVSDDTNRADGRIASEHGAVA